ncbi:MAG TPA: EamA family transporter [Terriglobales bacterium]|nr:EamA family transporter [Terriglobales bacterium]
MQVWLIGSIILAIIFGFFNVFNKIAAGKISDSLGALLVESTAVLCILLLFVYLSLTGKRSLVTTSQGVIFSILAGICVGIGSVLYFFIFRSKGELSIAGPIVWGGSLLIMAIAGLVFLKEPFSIQKLLGVALSLIGLMLLAGSR